jgi:hypothetical protein
MAGVTEVTRPSKINGLNLQTALMARIDAKGISGALTNLSKADRPEPPSVLTTLRSMSACHKPTFSEIRMYENSWSLPRSSLASVLKRA